MGEDKRTYVGKPMPSSSCNSDELLDGEAGCSINILNNSAFLDALYADNIYIYINIYICMVFVC